MTIEQLESLPFKYIGNEITSMKKLEYRVAYYNEQYDIMIIIEEKWIRKGLRINRIFKYKGKQYRKIEQFLGVIKDIEFVA